MARSLVLGNGNMLVCYDEWGQVRDFHFPYVGLENHVGEKLMHRIGVYAEGTLRWLSDGSFNISIQYEKDSFVANVIAKHKELQIELHFSDIVYNEHDIYVRHIEVHNLGNADRAIKLFFNQQFHISESRHGDTGYYSPELHAVVHYKGRRVFLISAKSNDAFFDDYSVGLLGIEGKEGTWRDAEDGVLSKSAIEHGSVDSVIGISLFVPTGGIRLVSYWVACGETYRRVERYHRDILSRGPEHLRKTTSDYWKAWVNPDEFAEYPIDKKFIDLYRRSLLVMRAHTDNRGPIIASGDSSILQNGRDTYSYCWPRDAAYISSAYIQSGHLSSSLKFIDFCNDLLTDDGYLLHKYRSDKSLGSSWHPWVRDGRAQPPIQEDETAITLVTLHEHYKASHDVELIERLYNPYIKRVASFLCSYRDKKVGLPLPSHDLWEEQFGTFTYTSASVYAGLKAAANFAQILGKEVARRRWESAAEEIKEGILTKLIHSDGRVLKSLRYTHTSPEPDFTADASSFYGLFHFGVLAIDDPKLFSVYKHVKEKLTVAKGVGGIARYEGDNYFSTGHDTPGNPWIITTLWFAEYEILRAKNKTELEATRKHLQWALDKTNASGMLSEQLDAHSGEAVSVMPLVWSHAQYVQTFLAYVKKLKELGLGYGDSHHI
jgi:GH15 family glucan-1,4-alpha-glucosidase